MGVLTDQPRSADVIAFEDSMGFLITKKDLIDLFIADNSIYRKILLNVLKILSNKLYDTNGEIEKLRERYQSLTVDDHSTVFNTDLIAALELGSMLDVAETVAQAALLRQESRGSHSRSDFESRDDERFLKHSLAYKEEGQPRIDYLPATITRWQPEERKY